HLHDLAILTHDASDLEVRLPGAARLVVGVRDVVAERDALAAHVAAAAIDGHATPPPARCAPCRRHRLYDAASSGCACSRPAASRTADRFPGTACRRFPACECGGPRDDARAACPSWPW